jgi:hypothetical protein
MMLKLLGLLDLALVAATLGVHYGIIPTVILGWLLAIFAIKVLCTTAIGGSPVLAIIDGLSTLYLLLMIFWNIHTTLVWFPVIWIGQKGIVSMF